MAFVKIAKKSDIEKSASFEINGYQIAIFNVGGEFFAIDNECPHRKGPLVEGVLEENVVACPWHGWRFDVKTGVSTSFPVKVRKYALRLEGNDIFVDLPE